ncbi:MAG TPA: tetratricopeptide repeat protein [Gaiellaceae bacterium]|nr:tetratricopeptide repeat protein [Gaiellaceae bacterium]
MTSSDPVAPRLATSDSPSTLGQRVREARVARGLTQSELAESRFSKQYVSQIERDRLRPADETLEWLAERLGVDAQYLATGVSGRERERVESAVARAEAAVEAHEYGEATGLLDGIAETFLLDSAPDLELRALFAESWARMYLGEMQACLPLLARAREIAEQPSFSDVDRAEVLFRLGCCRYKMTSISTAMALFKEALELAERSGIPCDRLRSRIFGWRSRCYRRQRDWEAAREDVERALELAEALDDRRGTADAYFLGALVAERRGQWLAARSYAERAKVLYEEVDDRANTGKLLTTLGGLTFLLGRPDESIPFFKEAFSVALDVGSEADAAQAVSSLAQVHLRTGRVELAEEQARHALELLDGRVDFIDEIGNAQLVLGRSLLEQGRLEEAEQRLRAAEESFDQLSSASHRAAAWTAQAELAVRRGDTENALRLYQRAVEALQDFRF